MNNKRDNDDLIYDTSVVLHRITGAMQLWDEGAVGKEELELKIYPVDPTGSSFDLIVESGEEQLILAPISIYDEGDSYFRLIAKNVPADWVRLVTTDGKLTDPLQVEFVGGPFVDVVVPIDNGGLDFTDVFEAGDFSNFSYKIGEYKIFFPQSFGDVDFVLITKEGYKQLIKPPRMGYTQYAKLHKEHGLELLPFKFAYIADYGKACDVIVCDYEENAELFFQQTRRRLPDKSTIIPLVDFSEQFAISLGLSQQRIMASAEKGVCNLLWTRSSK
jgi:hypothetical protein